MNIIDNHNLLDPQQVNLLHTCGSQLFNLGKFQSLDSILTSLKVDVIIETGINTRTIPSALADAEEFWRNETNRLESLIPDAEDREKAMEDYREASKNRDVIYKEKEQWATMTLRGLYDPKANLIKLYPEAMKQEYNGTRMDELLVSTLAHETMHAYFNRPRHKSFPYVISVEEPLAEFGMLLYLHEASSSCYNWAYQDVSAKKTCYRYGAKLMDQHLNEGQNSSVLQYLEAYKIKLNNYPIPTVNPIGGQIVLPMKGGRSNSPVQVGGQMITSHWHDVFKYPPCYFYDRATHTLGLDGEWSSEDIRHSRLRCVDIDIMIDIDIMHHNPINQIYLGDNFIINGHCFHRHLLSEHGIIVSPANKLLYANKGVAFYKKDHTPVLPKCGDGLYKLCRNGKWGVIDDQVNQVVPVKYDFIWSFDKNELIMVRVDNGCNYLYGLVNKQGQEQVPVIYEDITGNPNGTYTVKQYGSKFIIDKYGNKI